MMTAHDFTKTQEIIHYLVTEVTPARYLQIYSEEEAGEAHSYILVYIAAIPFLPST